MSSFIMRKSPIGPLDSDSSDYTIPSSSVRYRLNLRVGQGGDRTSGVLSNIAGNSQIEFDLPELGDNKCIGSYVSEVTNKAYIFNYNSEGYHGIYEFDYLFNTVVPVLISKTDSLGVDILNFSIDDRINHINIADGQSFTDEEEVTFSLTTGDGLSGTTAELISTGQILTESDSTAGVVSDTVTLSLIANQVKVVTDLGVATTITVNGETRTNTTMLSGTWTEIFIVSGINDIEVSVSSSSATSDIASGTWSFSNSNPANTFSGVFVNSIVFSDVIAPDTFPLANGDAGSLASPPSMTTINIAPVSNTFVVQTDTGVGGVIKLQIGAGPVVDYAVNTLGSTSIPSILMSPSDNVDIELSVTPPVASVGNWAFSCSHGTSTLDGCNVNGNAMPSIAPNNFPLSTPLFGSVFTPAGISVYTEIPNTVEVLTPTFVSGFIDVQINGGSPTSYAVDSSGITTVPITLTDPSFSVAITLRN